MQKFHTAVIGGGCLGSASAISLARSLKISGGKPESICLIEKNVLGSGISSRQSGLIRSANADETSAHLAKISTDMWLNIKKIWGIDLEVERAGALWIVKKGKNDSNKKWDAISQNLKKIPIDFKRITLDEAHLICPDFINLYEDEIFYHEPEGIQLDPSHLRQQIYQGIKNSNITLFEGEEVVGFKKNKSEKITEIILTNHTIQVEHVINAAGPWSPKLFEKLGITIPISVEPVFIANWFNSLASKSKTNMPIIADYVNRAYFRSWRDGEIHMHQPRKREIQETASAFIDNPMGIIGADFINDPFNQMQGSSHTHLYKEIANKRFNNLKNTVLSTGFRSYFDITPDLKFILGPDEKIKNLIHCLGSGQAAKYSPVFGEMMAQYIFKPGQLSGLGNNFSIKRFNKKYMKEFLKKSNTLDYSLLQENSSL
jgi:sarcosine oxidase subunit beta